MHEDSIEPSIGRDTKTPLWESSVLLPGSIYRKRFVSNELEFLLLPLQALQKSNGGIGGGCAKNIQQR